MAEKKKESATEKWAKKNKKSAKPKDTGSGAAKKAGDAFINHHKRLKDI